MKKIMTMLLLLLVFLLGACNTSDSAAPSAHEEDYLSVPNSFSEPPEREFEYEYFTFEETLLEFPPTDVVIAQYIGHRPFGENATEFEFIVLDRVLGNAADRIFVYAERTNATVTGIDRPAIKCQAQIL
ncbi:MAG: hypothetical protein FWE28_09160 [Oscillospiraceae bacterium]|nr:hypothetical protein [Oscillospiraceae bacterium]